MDGNRNSSEQQGSQSLPEAPQVQPADKEMSQQPENNALVNDPTPPPANNFRLRPARNRIVPDDEIWYSPEMRKLIDFCGAALNWAFYLVLIACAYFTGTYYSPSGCNDTSVKTACLQLTAGTYDQCEKRLSLLSNNLVTKAPCPDKTLVLVPLILVSLILFWRLFLILELVTSILGRPAMCSKRVAALLKESIQYTSVILYYISFGMLVSFLSTTENDPNHYCTDGQREKWIWDIGKPTTNDGHTSCAEKNQNMYKTNLLIAATIFVGLECPCVGTCQILLPGLNCFIRYTYHRRDRILPRAVLDYNI